MAGNGAEAVSMFPELPTGVANGFRPLWKICQTVVPKAQTSPSNEVNKLSSWAWLSEGVWLNESCVP